MDKLRLLRSNSWCRLGVSRVSTFCGRFYSSASDPDPTDTIYSRISRAGHPTNSMTAILEEWLEQGRDLKRSVLQGLVKQLRKYNRSGHALQVSEWMFDQMNYPVSPGDIAIRKGHLEKAEAYVNGFIESGKDPDATTWDRLATGYHANGQMAKSVEAMKKAILADRPGWTPNTMTLAAILEYLKEQDDVGAAEEFLKLLQERGHSSTGIYDKLGSDLNKEILRFEAIAQMEREEHIG
ncbi:hypothetical protein QYF36_019489 [Acer negundo]|nr:hypothetical protein QYF36_019489 [Acer negundo]